MMSKQPKAMSPFATSLTARCDFGMNGLGMPQCGHFFARRDISVPHSVQGFSAIA